MAMPDPKWLRLDVAYMRAKDAWGCDDEPCRQRLVEAMRDEEVLVMGSSISLFENAAVNLIKGIHFRRATIDPNLHRIEIVGDYGLSDHVYNVVLNTEMLRQLISPIEENVQKNKGGRPPDLEVEQRFWVEACRSIYSGEFTPYPGDNKSEREFRKYMSDWLASQGIERSKDEWVRPRTSRLLGALFADESGKAS
jgi:hypothetical protein